MKTTAPEKKSVKTLKGQLFGAVSMMLVAAIALGTSTYAWFINNQTVEVQQMDLTVSTSTSLLVALGRKDALNESTGAISDWTGFKNVVTNPDIITTYAANTSDTAGWTDFLSNPFTPASITSTNLALTTPTFFATNNHVSNGKLDEFDALTFTSDAENVGQGSVKRLPLRFSASNDMEVYFDSSALADSIANIVATSATGDAINGVALADQATAIRRALRVAIVPQKNDQYIAATDPVRVFQFDNGTAISTNGNNTDYGTATGSAAHVETAGTYKAISTLASDKARPNVTDSGYKIATFDALNALVPSLTSTPGSNADLALATKEADGTYAKPTGGVPLFTLTAGDERNVDVYIWLEGTDNDCLNELSAYHFGVVLPFCAVLPTPAVP